MQIFSKVFWNNNKTKQNKTKKKEKKTKTVAILSKFTVLYLSTYFIVYFLELGLNLF